jgi:hypothetical protein
MAQAILRTISHFEFALQEQNLQKTTTNHDREIENTKTGGIGTWGTVGSRSMSRKRDFVQYFQTRDREETCFYCATYREQFISAFANVANTMIRVLLSSNLIRQ